MCWLTQLLRWDKEDFWKRQVDEGMKIVVMLYPYLPQNMTMQEWQKMWRESLVHITQIKEVVIVEDHGEYCGEKLDRLLENADAVIGLSIQKDLLTEEFFEKHSGLKYIGTLSHGYGEFDKEIVKKHNVVITNAAYGSHTVAQYTMALLLDICNGIDINSAYLKEVYWRQDKKGDRKAVYVHSQIPQIELYGKKMGIIGLGNIGYRVAQMAQGFGMEILGYAKNNRPEPEYDFIRQVSFRELLRESDVISLNCPLTEQTAGMINKKTIAEMKQNVILLNTARGGLICEEDLAEALRERRIYAAGLDVMCEEPAIIPSSLMQNPYCKVTGHIAWMTRDACIRMMAVGIQHFQDYINDNITGEII